MSIALRANNSTADFEHHLAQIDEHGITVVTDVLSSAELRTLPALIDRACAIRELHPLQEDAKVQNFNMCSNLVNHDPFFEQLCLPPAVYSIMQRLLGAGHRALDHRRAGTPQGGQRRKRRPSADDAQGRPRQRRRCRRPAGLPVAVAH